MSKPRAAYQGLSAFVPRCACVFALVLSARALSLTRARLSRHTTHAPNSGRGNLLSIALGDAATGGARRGLHR